MVLKWCSAPGSPVVSFKETLCLLLAPQARMEDWEDAQSGKGQRMSGMISTAYPLRTEKELIKTMYCLALKKRKKKAIYIFIYIYISCLYLKFHTGLRIWLQGVRLLQRDGQSLPWGLPYVMGAAIKKKNSTMVGAIERQGTIEHSDLGDWQTVLTVQLWSLLPWGPCTIYLPSLSLNLFKGKS